MQNEQHQDIFRGSYTVTRITKQILRDSGRKGKVHVSQARK